MNILDIAIAKQLAGGGGSGTDNYNELSNLPKINGTTLSGDKSSSSLGLQSEIKEGAELASDLVDDSESDNKFVTSAEKLEWSGKQNLIDSSHKLSSDLVNDADKTNKFVTASEKETWNGKQNLIDNSHKLSSDLVDDTNKTNKFVTSTEKNTWNAKQNAIDADHKLSSSLVSFSEAETAALASGINSTKVGQISTNQTNILYGINSSVINIVPPRPNKLTSENCTAICDGEGKVELSGTSSTNLVTFDYNDLDFTTSGNYHLTGCPANGSSSTYELSMQKLTYAEGSTIPSVEVLAHDYGSGADFEINAPSSDNIKYRLRIVVRSNITPPSAPFYPMVSRLDYSSFQPYAVTNTTLTSVVASTINKGVKNVIKYVTPNGTGIANNPNLKVTIDDESGIVSVSGSTVSNGLIRLTASMSNLKGMVLSGKPYINDDIMFAVYTVSGDSRVATDNGDGIIAVIPTNDAVRVCLYVYANKTINMQFTPMLCTEAEWAISKTFVPPAKPNYDLTRLQSEDRASLAEVVDSGAKNILDFANLQFQTQAGTTHTKTDTDITVASTGTSTWAACTYKMSLSAGNYVFSAKISNLSIGSGGVAKICLDTQADGHGTRAATLAVEQNGTVSKPFTWGGGTLYIMYYPNYSGNLVVTTFKASENMICTKAAFGVSSKFVPYRPNWELVYGLELAPGLPTNADLNTYKTPGRYRVQTISISRSLVNSPIDKTNGGVCILEVKTFNDTDRLIQELTEVRLSADPMYEVIVYRRYWTSASGGAWGDWMKFSGTIAPITT